MDEQATKQTLSVREAAARLGVSLPTLYAAIRSGQVPALRIRGRVLVLRKPFERLLRGERPADAA